MFFPFTFNFNVPGLANPFGTSSATAASDGRTNQSPGDICHSQAAAPGPHYLQSQSQTFPECSNRPSRSRANLPKINRPRPSPSPSPAPLTRKRGWEPTFAEPSRSTTTLTSTRGYLDTPAKYREMAATAAWNDAQSGGYASGDGYGHITMNDQQDRQEYEDDEMPPMKKRRGLAGSIVSTALSAALIGTAVGLTVYRLWRDRGKEQPLIENGREHEALPPPPYESSPPSQWERIEQPAAIRVTPATPRSAKKGRPVQVTAHPKRPIAYNRRPRKAHLSPAPIVQHKALQGPPRPEFDFGHQEEEGPVEDKMDWIGDKLAMLIEQGKRALNAEVVVMSDAKEDEVDDGMGAWEEDDAAAAGRSITASPSRSRSGSVRRAGGSIRKPKALNLGSASARTAYTSGSASASNSPSPYVGSFEASASAPAHGYGYETPRRTHVRGVSVESGFPSSTSLYGQLHGSYSTTSLNNANVNVSAMSEEPAVWESPELKESMERARARLIARRMGGGT